MIWRALVTHYRWVQFRGCWTESVNAQMLGGPEQDLPDRLLAGCNNHKLEKIAVSSQAKTYSARQCTFCAIHKTHSEMRYICKFCHVLLYKCSCFERFHSWGTTGFPTCRCHTIQLQSNLLELQNVSKVTPCIGELNVCKIFGNWCH